MAEEKKEKEIMEEVKAEAEEVKAEAEERAEEVKAEAVRLSSTEAKRKKKAERRDAKAARKEANKIEEKKRRPNNGLLAILIFGVLIVMFAFVGLYNYFQKPASIEKYIDDSGYAEVYTNAPVDEYTTMTMRAEGNTIKMVFKVAEDAPEEILEQYKGDDGKEMLENMGASFLTSIKPLTRGFGGEIKVGVKQGDETINYVKLSYSEAKKIVKEAQEEAEEAADDTGDTADDAADAAEDAADAADEAADEAEDAAESEGE